MILFCLLLAKYKHLSTKSLCGPFREVGLKPFRKVGLKTLPRNVSQEVAPLKKYVFEQPKCRTLPGPFRETLPRDPSAILVYH